MPKAEESFVQSPGVDAGAIKQQMGGIKLGFAFAVTCWMGIVCVSLLWLHQYETKAGSSNVTLTEWPAESTIRRRQSEPTLLLFIHPRCPCSSASLVELDKILQETNRSATIVVWLPDNASKAWTDSRLVRQAEAIESASIVLDRLGTESRLFGVETSGHCIVFDENACLVFSGGITGSRGHVGDNVGGTTAAKQLLGGDAKNTFPVFGCPIE